eukprot:TRINITY_DN61432_c0_g1_i1.p1 TRINITY_DN61432_c0_g1~~TRINITY_DN61432_c0_g1_i1.p1  ORF type:complete len:438 (-),score=35.09 TRINITY_DN61432_c0_g1_i1:9-1241(-)
MAGFRLLMAVCLPMLLAGYIVTQHMGIRRDPWLVFRSVQIVSFVTCVAHMPSNWKLFGLRVREHWRIVVLALVVDAAVDWLRELPKILGVPLLIGETLRQTSPLLTITVDRCILHKPVPNKKLGMAISLMLGATLLICCEYANPVLIADPFRFCIGVLCLAFMMVALETYERISHGAASSGLNREFAFLTTLLLPPWVEVVLAMRQLVSGHAESFGDAFVLSKQWWLQVAGIAACAWAVGGPVVVFLFAGECGSGEQRPASKRGFGFVAAAISKSSRFFANHFQGVFIALILLHIFWRFLVNPGESLLGHVVVGDPLGFLHDSLAVFGPPMMRLAANPFLLHYGAFGVSVLDLRLMQTAGRIGASLVLAGIAAHFEGKMLRWWHGVAGLCLLGPGLAMLVLDRPRTEKRS